MVQHTLHSVVWCKISSHLKKNNVFGQFFSKMALERTIDFKTLIPTENPATNKKLTNKVTFCQSVNRLNTNKYTKHYKNLIKNLKNTNKNR